MNTCIETALLYYFIQYKVFFIFLKPCYVLAQYSSINGLELSFIEH